MIDPDPAGIEYIEIYNRGNFPVNLKDIYLALLNQQQTYTYIQPISISDIAIYPNEFWVICADVERLKSFHQLSNERIIGLNIPALNNTSAH